ncbi:MAG: TPM domain-containing protein [Planctomycetota bacterium]
MHKVILPICVLVFFSGCEGDKDVYPKRPKDTPYYLNETSVTEMNQNARMSLREAREKTGIEYVTVILETLPEKVRVEEYAAGLFHEWKIGSRTDGKGVLLLFIEDTHTLKIEVSYELEGVFTDAFCSSFQPTVKSYYAGRYFGDVFCGLVECFERRILVEEDIDVEARLKGIAQNPEVLKSSEVFLSGGAGIIDDEYFYEKDAKLSFIREISAEKIREFDGDRDIDVVLDRYFKSLEEGINYPFLGLLTEGSRMKRLEYPESAHFYKSRWEDCRRAFPYRIRYKGDLAAVIFSKKQSFPIFLRKDGQGNWRVDAARAWVSSWQKFAKNESGPLHKDHPWMFAYGKFKKSQCNVPDLLPASLSLADEISRLKKAIKAEPEKASNYFKLADRFYWDCLWIGAAIDLVEKGLDLEPDNVPYRWLIVFMRYRFPDPESNEKHLEKLLEIDPYDIDALRYYSQHQWYYTMQYSEAMQTLGKLKAAEQKQTDDTWFYKWHLNDFKANYWNQIAVDRNIVWKIWDYLYIFYRPYAWYFAAAVLLPMVLVVITWLVVVILILRYITKSSVQN